MTGRAERPAAADGRYLSELTESAVRRDSAVHERLLHTAAHHEQWTVRAASLEILAEHFLTETGTARALARATHDSVDWVAFTAIRLIGFHRIRSAVPDLIKISGWPSNFSRPTTLRKPVGCGAAFAKQALISIFGTNDPQHLRNLENEYFVPWRRRVETRRRRRNTDDVVLVPAGTYRHGSDPEPTNPFRMDDTDNPPRDVFLPAFYIDRTAVTNARYAVFLKEAGGGSAFDHPDQPTGKGHEPAHIDDPRFNRPDLPVVGIDWYDAWAFARWAGGMLPSEEQWERAARGADGRKYPWGDVFEPDRVQYVEHAFSRPVSDIAELDELLVTAQPSAFPAVPVLPADSLVQGASPYGAVHMAGNVWEITRTNYFSREDMDPFFKGRDPVEFMNRKEAFHVLRGGSWTSPPSCLTTHYRGRDLITDRHSEVGFRCVYRLDDD
ncbi:formylglycine-generating enzyme family protein [Streptomyces sp. NRRL S-474]|uniref:formylglycine-generating enzyme family protein n=2 Tax=unclassified Streptomyces TaxID=2593676 RepID=UPI00068BE5F0|nr:SUMF1/EgtB/PvdO family nonheme iron enzyme [Streptomyces sp. NRRL S-474]